MHIASPLPLTGSVAGSLRHADGSPVADAEVVLGLRVEVGERDPATYLDPAMHYYPTIGEQAAMGGRTDSDGRFHLDAVPAGRHEFLAVRLGPLQHDIATRFLVHGVVVEPGRATTLNLCIDPPWHSAPPRTMACPFPDSLTHEGVACRLVRVVPLHNPFHYDFPRQPVTVDLNVSADELLVLDSARPGVAQPFQIDDRTLTFFTDLLGVSDRWWAIYHRSSTGQTPPAWTPQVEPGGATAIIDTGEVQFRIPWGHCSDGAAPLLGLRGADSVWRGHGQLRLPPGRRVLDRTTNLVRSGPLILTVRIDYSLGQGDTYSVELTAHHGERYLLVRETCPALEDAAFEFSLPECVGGRGHLHWKADERYRWEPLAAEDRELARLQESVAWWVPPQGFAYAMATAGDDNHDAIAVFTVRRGEWIDRAFEAICNGPGDAPEARELDWPYPEMVGSTISMITARTTRGGDALFRFGFFDGQRQWGILASTRAALDLPIPELSVVQHKLSSPRLQEFKDWRLDEQDRHPRPSVVVKRDELLSLRRKKYAPPFDAIWSKIAGENVPGPATGVRFAVEGDPLVAWRKKRELVGVAHIRARMSLLGREFGDMYSPVGARPVTQWAEDYDLIAPSGAFTPDEERLVRQFLMLMGHLYSEPDLMNWRLGSRNANFEADRVDVVGTIGLVFRGNPDADTFVAHAAGLMRRSLDTYCTPGSGKWYENPACYYLQALKCRTNLTFHLARHGAMDPTAIPRLKDFLRWGVLLLTPPYPADAATLREGSDRPYDELPKARRIPPIGDHATIGRPIPEHFALMATLYRCSDPAFADELLWAYRACGADGGAFGNLPLLFAALDPDALKPPLQMPALVSRRLEGFGAVMRDRVGEPDELYLLLKQGPGGYRYHGSEGSFLLFADGRPLVFDGGEAGEVWRHSTLSFGETHTPMSAGRVERFAALPGLDFVQGVHPTIIGPGEPIYLSDDCHHSLIAEAHRRYSEPKPANVRSVLRVGCDYVVVHDELRPSEPVASHWHLQVLADGCSGDAGSGFHFRGRFGVDLQVLLPGQAFDAATAEPMPLIEYRGAPEELVQLQHLRLTRLRPGNYLAVLRPLSRGRLPLAATAIVWEGRVVGAHITGEGIDDLVFFSHRQALHMSVRGVQLDGRYGVVLQRGKTVRVQGFTDSWRSQPKVAR